MSSKSRGVFRTHASICDRAFLWIYLTAFYFCNISTIIDLQLGYILASEKKYWDSQSEAKKEQIIAIVTTHSVSCSFAEKISTKWDAHSLASSSNQDVFLKNFSANCNANFLYLLINKINWYLLNCAINAICKNSNSLRYLPKWGTS